MHILQSQSTMSENHSKLEQEWCSAIDATTCLDINHHSNVQIIYIQTHQLAANW